MPQQFCSLSEHNSSSESGKAIVAQQPAITNEMQSCQAPCETDFFLKEEITEEEKRSIEPTLDFDSAPSTPQLIQATRADISLDGSHHSDDCTCTKSEVEDDLSTDDNCSFSHVRNDADEMDGACLFEDSHCDRYDFNDLESLEAALCEDVVDDMQYQGLDFQDNLANELVDELLCIDMHSSIMDNISGCKGMELSSANIGDEAEQNDEEALLLAEVAKAEAGMSSCSSSTSFACDFKSTHEDSNIHGDESYLKQCVSTSNDSELTSGNRNKSGGSKKKMKV